MKEENKIFLVGISGSPRKGATDYIINDALNYAKSKFKEIEIDYYSLMGKKINFCIHCDYCIREKKGCIHEDAMMELYPKLIKANVWKK